MIQQSSRRERVTTHYTIRYLSRPAHCRAGGAVPGGGSGGAAAPVAEMPAIGVGCAACGVAEIGPGGGPTGAEVGGAPGPCEAAIAGSVCAATAGVIAGGGSTLGYAVEAGPMPGPMPAGPNVARDALGTAGAVPSGTAGLRGCGTGPRCCADIVANCGTAGLPGAKLMCAGMFDGGACAGGPCPGGPWLEGTAGVSVCGTAGAFSDCGRVRGMAGGTAGLMVGGAAGVAAVGTAAGNAVGTAA